MIYILKVPNDVEKEKAIDKVCDTEGIAIFRMPEERWTTVKLAMQLANKALKDAVDNPRS